MLNPMDIDYIIKTTLYRLGENDPAMIRLIKGTFLYESGLEELGDRSNTHNPLRGFGMMSDERIEHLVTKYLMFRPLWKNKIKSAFWLPIESYPLERLKEDTDTNVAVSVMLLCYWYKIKVQTMPSDDIMEIAKCYRDHYYFGDHYPDLVEDFVEYYNAVFKV